MLKYPVIIFVIAFTIGILLQSLFPIDKNTYIIVILFFISLLIISFFLKQFFSKLFLRSIVLFSVLCFGAIYIALYQANTASYPFEKPKIRKAKIIATIEKIDLIKTNKISTEINIISVNGDDFNNNVSRKFLCNIWKDSTKMLESIYQEIKIGNTISFEGTINRTRNKRNPGEFDYEKYLIQKGIAGIISCYKIETIKIINRESDFLSNIVFDIRKNINFRIDLIFDDKSSALLKGILLADRSDIDFDIKKTFINTGVIHVLAVSGLHVGFIMLIFFIIFGRLDIRVKYSLTIIGILCFLIITGGHSSVFRASTMAIVFLIAKLFGRSTNGFNSISIAALIILLINPNELMNPGFLLSFSAVISILLLYPILSEKINKLTINGSFKKLLLFLSVSFVAQIGTLPFTLIYFNKLSLVSLFTNLIVIPVIGLIVAISILTVSVSLISF